MTYNGVDNGRRLYATTAGEDGVEGVDDPRRPGDGEWEDDQQEGDGDVALLTADAAPLLGRVEPHSDAVAADDGERQPVTDADDEQRNGVAGDDDREEVGERGDVGRVARSALRRSRFVDDVGQRTDGRRAGCGRPQPRSCHTYIQGGPKIWHTFCTPYSFVK